MQIGSYSLGSVIALFVLIIAVVLIVLSVAGVAASSPLLLLGLVAALALARLC